ncbi:hypothetical protein [Streptomyces sp. NPDC048508]|uniref:hypothetical protein n=1 Tax=Streptomyces sp. NPDC048508 TaxID=3365561 RepID=UPI0037205B31
MRMLREWTHVSGFDVHRVAEVIVVDAFGLQRRGSGYRITTGAVLTAAHVAAEAVNIHVRFDADQVGLEWSCPATVGWCDGSLDVAILEFTPPPDKAPVTTVSLGRLDDRHAVIEVHTAGFPLWKMRADPAGIRYRDLVHAVGTLAVLSNRRSGTLEIIVIPPGEVVEPRGLPWEAMSGAAVWAGDRMIGVVVAQFPNEGHARLVAARIDRCLRSAVAAGDHALSAILEVADSNALPDVIPRTTRRLDTSGHREYAEDLVPLHGLRGREAELDTLAGFCAGAEPYFWWQAEPWAGKSALLAEFVIRPPAGVDVVSFFVRSGIASHGDSVQFTTALIDQLSMLLGQAAPDSVGHLARDRDRRELLVSAARKLDLSDRQLVLVVDGLDEDMGAMPGSAVASIASLLPKHPPRNLRVIVASRPDPPLPDDVPADHPFRLCQPQVLTVSPYATDVRRSARRELSELLTGGDDERAVIGLLTASGGGLSVDDLQRLTGIPRPNLDRMLGGVFGRTVAERHDGGMLDIRRALLFTHETLEAEAAERIGSEAEQYYRRIRDWAEEYRQLGWPETTPAYLLRGYARMLQTNAEVDELIRLVMDEHRLELMLRRTGSDAAALAEFQQAQEALGNSGPGLDGDALLIRARFALRRDLIVERNNHPSPSLAVLWAKLGQRARAEAVAMALHQPYRKESLAALVEVAANQRDITWGRELAAAILDPNYRIFPLTQLIDAAGAGKQYSLALEIAADAEQLLAKLRDPGGRQRALELVTNAVASIVEAVAAGGDLDRALLLAVSAAPAARDHYVAHAAAGAVAAAHGHRASEIVSEITDPHLHQYGLLLVARAFAVAGDSFEAHRIVARLEDPIRRLNALIAIARASLSTETGTARQLAHEAEALAGIIDDTDQLQATLRSRAVAAVLLGDPDRALALAMEVMPKHNWKRLFDELVETASQAGDHAQALRIAEGAKRAPHRADALTTLLRAAFHADATVRSGELAQRLFEELRTMQAGEPELLYHISKGVRVLAEAGELEKINALIQQEVELDVRVRILTALAAGALASGATDLVSATVDRVRDLAATYDDPHRRFDALLALASLTAEDRECAIRFAHDAQRVALTIPPSSVEHMKGLCSLVVARMWSGDVSGAVALTQMLRDTQDRARLFGNAIAMLARHGHLDTAKELFAEAATTFSQCTLNSTMEVGVLASLLPYDQARIMIDRLDHVEDRATAMCEMAGVATANGDHEVAAALMNDMWVLLIGHPEMPHSWTLQDYVTASAKTGIYEHAPRVIVELKAPLDREAAVYVAESMAERELYAEVQEFASAFASQFGHPDLRDVALAAAVRSGAQSGHRSWADSTVTSIEDDDIRIHAQACVAADSGSIDEAVAIAVTVPDEDWRDKALVEISWTARDSKDFAQARAVIALIEDDGWQAHALNNLARHAQTSNLWKLALNWSTEAYTIAREYEFIKMDDPRRDECIEAGVNLFTSLAALGEMTRAQEVLFDAIIPPAERASVLVRASQRVEDTLASSLLGDAFLLGHWSTPLRQLSPVSLPFALHLADEISH